MSDEYTLGLNGCEHNWRMAGITDGPDDEELDVKWCTACGCLARAMPDGTWHIMYPDAQDGSDDTG